MATQCTVQPEKQCFKEVLRVPLRALQSDSRVFRRLLGRGWLRWFAHPLRGAVCRDHMQYSGLAPGTSEVAAALGPFCIIVHNLPQLPMHGVIFSLLKRLCICCSRRRLSRYKHCSKGSQVLHPSLSPGEEEIFSYITQGGPSEVGS